MTDTIAEKVGNFIVNIRDKSRPVHISWFGGEPTFNTKPMEIIYNKLIKNNIPFATSMISNGYLLDKELCDTMVDKYKLGTVQITLDGTEEVYNKAKDYIYENDESPYQVVMENIKYLCEKGVSVTIRMNLDLYNANSLKKLIPELRMRFGNYPKFGVYAYPIFEDTLERNWEHRVKVFKELEEIVYILDECNFMQGAKLHCGLKTQHCMVDGTDSILINPSGYIGLCEHYTVNHFFSHVDNYEKKNWDEVIAFRTYLEPKELCKKCPLLPNCLRIDLCHDIRYCDELTRDWRLHEASLAARNQVINYFRNMNNNMNSNMKNSCQCKPTNFKDKVKNLFKKKCNDKSC